MRHATLSGLLLVGLCATGCEPYPDSPVFIYGLALREDGTPFRQTALSLEGASTPVSLDAFTFTPYATVTTHENGAFALEIPAGDIMPRVDGVDSRQRPTFRERFRVATPLEKGRGAFLSFTLTNGGGDSELPMMHVWDARLAWADAPAGRVLTFAPPPPTPEAPEGIVVDRDELPPGEEPPDDAEDPIVPLPSLQLHGPEGRLWQEHGVTAPWTLAPWLAEDFPSLEAQVRVVSVGAWNRMPLTSPESWLRFRLEWRSERLALPAGTLRPLSRGAACLPALETPCPFTDGRLAEAKPSELWPGGAPSEPPPTVGVALDAPARVSRVVIRGLTTAGHVLAIEGSEDGVQWTELTRRTLTETDGETGNSRSFRSLSHADSPWDPPLRMRGQYFLDVPLPGAPQVRYVRLVPLWRGTKAMVTTSLAEVSLFE
jgi:hypothetical protein